MRTHYHHWSWERPLAFCLLLMAMAVAATVAMDGGWSLGLGCWIALCPFAALALPTAWPGRLGPWLMLPVGMIVLSMALWMVAAIAVWKDQGRMLALSEILLRFADPVGRRFIWEMAWWQAPALALGLGAAFAGLLRLASVPSHTRSLVCLLAIALLSTFGGLLAFRSDLLGPRATLRWQLPMAAPWMSAEGLGLAGATRTAVDAGRVHAFRLHDDPLWEAGGEPLVQGLAGRYRGRSVVIVVMESQRLSDIDGLGLGAWMHCPSSPYLGSLVGRSLQFDNVIQAGLGSHTMAWALSTGLPFDAQGDPTQAGVDLAAQGPLYGFRQAGYDLEWMQSTDTAFSGLKPLLHRAGVKDWFDAAELSACDRSAWNSWGMPDSQICAIALARSRQDAVRGHPTLRVVETVSNHSPYVLPTIPGLDLPANLHGGMRYADRCLQDLVEGLSDLPAAQRPVIWITADHTVRNFLGDHPVFSMQPLEALRIPGLLLLPDGNAAGQVCSMPMSHEDVLDLLWTLVGDPGPAGTRKFLDRRRWGVATAANQTFAILTRDAWWHPAAPAGFRIQGRWQLEPGLPDPERRRLQEASQRLLALWAAICPE